VSDPIYINKDAEFLHSLGATYIEDGDFETGMRLQAAAKHLASLDEKVANFEGVSAYERGKLDAFHEYYGQSNLPVNERTAPMPAQRMGVGKHVAVKKIPMGQSGLSEPKEATPKKVSARLEKLNKLGLTLNLKIGGNL
jgi:hypothetical protein